MTSAPRIDTTRRTAHGTIALIELALRHLNDLHTLAYDRYRAAQQVKVSGTPATSSPLDSHGDPRARAAYEQLARSLEDIHADTAEAIHRALQQFDTGLIRQRRDTSADATSAEVLTAIAHHEQRTRTGATTSTPIVDQPLPRAASRYTNLDRLRSDLEQLSNAVRKAGAHPDRSRLTPLELAAWQRAHGHDTTRRKRKR